MNYKPVPLKKQLTLFPELEKPRGKKMNEYQCNIFNNYGKLYTELIKAENLFHLLNKIRVIPKYSGHKLNSVFLFGIKQILPL